MIFINLGTIKTVPKTGLANVTFECCADEFVADYTLGLRITFVNDL